MSEILRVGLLQMTSTDEVADNVQKVVAALSMTSADLLCTPENSLYFRLQKAVFAGLSLEGPEFIELQSAVDRKGTSLLLGSVALKEPAGVSNASVLLSPSASPEVLYRKIHLFDVDVEGAPPVRESEQFTYGPRPTIWEFKGWRFGLSICYDLRFPELYLEYARAGVDAILVPAAFLVPTGQAHWHTLLRARAIEAQAYVLAPAQAGQHQGSDGASRATYGHSLAVDPWGRVLVDMELNQSTAVVELDRNCLKKVRTQIPMKQHREQRAWKGTANV